MEMWVGVIVVGASLAAVVMLAMHIARKHSSKGGEFEDFVMGENPNQKSQRAGAPAAMGNHRKDSVSAATSAPGSIRHQETFRIWVTLSRPKDIKRLSKLRAKEMGVVASPARQLSEKVKRGAILEIVLTGPTLGAPQIHQVRWEGRPIEASFQLQVTAAFREPRALYDVTILLDRLCLGVIPVSIAVEHTSTPLEAVSQEMTPPRRVFVSYTSVDREIALVVARAYRRIGVETFMDRLSLEGGELWEERLAVELDKCDAVYLLWSKASSESKYVRWEVKRALDRRLTNAERKPAIITHIVGSPPPETPPEELKALQFNDPVFALWEESIRVAKANEARPN